MTMLKTMKAGVALSVLLLSAGSWDAAFAAHAPEGGKAAERHAERERRMEEAVSKLPEQKRQLFNETVNEVKEANKDTHERVRALHEEIRGILEAEAFDKDKFVSKSEEMQSLRDKLQKTRIEKIASVADKFAPEERKLLMRALKGPEGGRPHGHEGPGDEPEHEGQPEGQEEPKSE
jgi:uncharacterized membrane protein